MSAFRTEIAGLRALAVASVVLFHLKVQGFSGGFIGVDVFFVISGYLITRNILTELKTNQFSLARFYVRRIRRIFPALIFTVVATYVVGALWCSPLMFLDVAKECTHALLSIANIQYWRESHKYFAPNSDELALLHCWSLSAEEQFYLIWPLFIVCAQKLGRPLQAILVASLISLAAAIVVASSDSSATFFLTPFRVYEFGCGALVLVTDRVLISPRLREILSAGGILAIVASAAGFSSDMSHLELAMLVPCLGASAIIVGGGKTAGGRLISKPIPVGLGTISYSLYLCHWPVIFFARFIFGDAASSVAATAVMLLVMLAIATGMYLYIERPFIHSAAYRTAGFRRTAAVFWSTTLGLVAVTHATFVSRGLEWRIPAKQKEIAHLQSFPSGEGIEPVNGPVSFQLVGDSHAIQYQDGLSLVRRRLGVNMEVLGGPGCPILYGTSLRAHFMRRKCIEDRDKALARIERASLPIIFDQFWAFYDDDAIEYEGTTDPSERSKGVHKKLERALEGTLDRFVAAGKRVLLIGAQVDAACRFNRARLLQGPLPHAPLPPCPPGRKETAETSGAAINAMLARLQAKWPDNVELLRPVDYLCDTKCATMDNELWLYFDGTHFTVAGSYYMVRRAEAPLIRFLQSPT
jgi:peptidoglycan/LPS O-acetylase OafA/YrhL